MAVTYDTFSVIDGANPTSCLSNEVVSDIKVEVARLARNSFTQGSKPTVPPVSVVFQVVSAGSLTKLLKIGWLVFGAFAEGTRRDTLYLSSVYSKSMAAQYRSYFLRSLSKLAVSSYSAIVRPG